MIEIAVIIGVGQDRETVITQLSAEKDFIVLYTGVDGYDALILASRMQPNIIIMDLLLSNSKSIELAPILKRRSPLSTLIVLCPKEEDIVTALRPEISGYLLKHADLNELTNSVRSVFYGGLYISAGMRSRLLEKHLTHGTVYWRMLLFFKFRDPSSSVEFSITESQIIKGIMQGRSDQEIAEDLNMKAGSVRNCISAVRRKTGLCNRSQMVLCALEQGSISPPALEPEKPLPNK